VSTNRYFVEKIYIYKRYDLLHVVNVRACVRAIMMGETHVTAVRAQTDDCDSTDNNRRERSHSKIKYGTVWFVACCQCVRPIMIGETHVTAVRAEERSHSMQKREPPPIAFILAFRSLSSCTSSTPLLCW
jgi:hypothetical protein